MGTPLFKNLNDTDTAAAQTVKTISNVSKNSETSNINLMHFNIQGILGKGLDLELLLSIYQVDIICITEHWLKSCEITSFQLSDYVLINNSCRKDFQHGGVCIFSKEKFKMKPLPYKICIEKHFEITIATVDVMKSGAKLYIITVYRSPSGNLKIFIDKMYELMYYIYKGNSYYIVCGDMNINFLAQTSESKDIINLFSEFDMHNHISEPTRITATSATSIDVIFSNITVKSSLVKETHFSDHCFQICEFNLPLLKKCESEIIFKRDFSSSNLVTFRNIITHESWSEMYRSIGLDNMFNSFYSTIMFHFNNAFPYKKIQTNRNKKPWFNHHLKSLHQTLCDMSKLCKNTNNAVIKDKYNKLKIIYREQVKQAKANFNNNRISNTSNIMKESWKIINEMNGNTKKYDSFHININGEEIVDKTRLANYFNNFFLDIQSSKPDTDNLKFAPHSENTFYLYPTTPYEVEGFIMKTTLKPAAGIDEIYGSALRIISDLISIPLSYLINESFSEGKYPDSLKISKSVPVFKNKGARDDITNYRNICLQSQLAKLFDICYNTRLTQFLEVQKLLNTSQHGFRSKKSTSTAIAELCNSVYECLNNKQFPIALYFDLSRAFDTVDHDLLLEKLYRIGVRGVAYNWAASYLRGRRQIVVIDKYKSESRNVNIGVPQGSTLGPLFFIIFINDIIYSCTSSQKTIIYADDTNQLVTGNNLIQSVETANISALEFYQWCQYNGISVNVNKTFFMVFQPKNGKDESSQLIKMNHNSIEQVNFIKFLGVVIDQKMTWEQHIDYISSKLSTMCFIVRQLRATVSLSILKLAYYGLVQSILSYGLIFWGRSAHFHKVFVIQKKIIRCMVGAHPHTSCRQIFINLSILTLPSLYIYLVILNIKMRENSFMKINNVHKYDTRNNSKLYLYQPYSRLSVSQNSHIYQGITCFNRFLNLCGDVSVIQNFNHFKQKLYEYLVSKAFYSVEEYLGH